MIRLPLALLLLLAVPAVARAEAIEDFRAGVAAQQRGNLDDAIRLYGQAIDAGTLSRSDLSRALADRCNAFNERFLPERAIADCERAIALDPANASARLDRANARLGRGDFAEAMEDFDAAIRLRPGDAAAYNNRGNARLKLQRYAQAIADFTWAIRLQPDLAVAYVNRAYARLDTGAPATAAEDFAAALRLNPADAYVVIWLHIARSQAGQADRRELAANAAGLDRARWPTPVVDLFLGRTNAEALREKAAAAGDAAGGSRPSCEADFYLGVLAVERQATAEAIRLLGGVAARCPANSIEARAAAAAIRPPMR